MKAFLIIFSLFYFSLLAQSQVAFDKNMAVDYIHQLVRDIDVKLWNGVRDGLIQAYWSDSLNRPMSFDEIRERGGEWKQILPPDAKDSFDVKDSLFFLENSDELRGLTLSFIDEFNPSSLNVTSKLNAFAVNFNLFVSGAELGNIPLFWVKPDDLKSCYSESDWQIYQALFKQRIAIGSIAGYHQFEVEILEVDDYVSALLWLQHNGRGSLGRMLTHDECFTEVLAAYNTALPIQLLDNLVPSIYPFGEPEFKKPYAVFRDVKLRNEVTSIEPYRCVYRTEIIDDEDFYDYVVSFDFSGCANLAIHFNKGDTVLQFIFPECGETAAFDFYVDFQSIKPLMKPHDLVMFRALMAYMKLD